MAEIPQIYDIAKTLYDKLINYTKKLYDFMGDEYNVPENELICELDHFFQAILFRVAVSDNNLSDIELDFIKKIVEIDDMFKDDNLLRLGSLTDEQKKSYLDKCDSVLSVVPEFVKLSVLADKKVDSLCQVITPTHCQKIYDYLRRIANYLKYIDGNVGEIEDKTSKAVLKTVVAYYKKHYVKYAPSRKK